MLKTPPFLAHKAGSGRTLRPINVRGDAYKESWLQELLRQHPDILPLHEIEPVFWPAVPIGREVATGTGSIDNLFISHRGYLTVVETKLWRNPEAKREVLAQAIDYGCSVAKWRYADVDQVARAYTSRYEGQACGLVDWVEQRRGPVEGGRAFFEDTVTRNLRLGRFLTVIVGDRIRESLVDMLTYMNRYPHLAADVALVELHCYLWQENAAWPLLVVPNIVGRTQVVERSIVQVTLQREGNYEVSVVQQKEVDGTGPRRRQPLTEEAFWELLSERAPGSYAAAHELVETYRQKPGITIDPTESALVVRLDIQDTNCQASLFFVRSSAHLSVWPETIAAQLARAGVDAGPLRNYRAEVSRMLKMPGQLKDFQRPIGEVDLPAFRPAVDDFIASVQTAERVGTDSA